MGHRRLGFYGMICAVGVMYQYFAAPSDAEAANQIDGGPGGRMAPSPALQEAMRTRDREAIRLAMRPKLRSGETGLLVLATKGIDPAVQMATLEGLLTGQSFDDIIGGPRSAHVLAERDDGEQLVVTITDELQAALAAASTVQLTDVSRPWSKTDEFYGHTEPQALTHFLLELADLAREAERLGQRLYCWLCV
jgi:hypothetical protein